MKGTSAEIQTVLDVLAETPQRMASMVDSVEATRLSVRPDPESWSLNDILAHLRSCADVWGKSIMAMIAEDNPTLRYVSPRAWMRKTNYPDQEFHTSLHAFTRQRNDLLRSLRALAIEDWSRRATFTGTVKGRDQTVFNYAQRIADHETTHLEQIESILHNT